MSKTKIIIAGIGGDLLRTFPKMTGNSLLLLKATQVLNLVSIIGIWYFQKWGVWFALLLAIIVLALDIYYHIWYHIPVVLISCSLLGWFVSRQWELFK
jgi:hypothetical protein